MHNNRLEEISWQSDRNDLFGQDSIEIAESDDILDQSDLTERIEEAEKRFSTSSITTSYFSSERFEYPALYRVLFMGAADQEIKKRLLEKLGQGFIHVLLDQQKDEPMTPFREIKHNLVPLNNFYLDQTIISASYEEYGVSIIEADFTWQSTAAECSDDPAQLLLHYAWKQCPNPDQLPSAHLGHDLPDEFQGMMCSEKTPNGIDLCVYVYDDHNDDRMRRDMQLLYKIRKLGIYVLPLTTGRSEQVKSYFAKVLTQYQVPCLDLSNIQVGKPPSFQYKGDRLSRIQGMECRQSNRPAVASYQILAVDQFCAIKSTNILELLKRTRDREVERDENKRQDYNALLSLGHPTESPSAPAEPPRVSEEKREGVKMRQRLMVIFALLSLFCAVYIARTPTVIWTASFEIDQETGAISLFTKNPQGKLAWATTDPMIWLNDQTWIPLQKIPQSAGYYRLFLTMQQQPQQLTLHNHHLYTPCILRR
ncbi:hypothetical protein G6F35_007943 [Rhizopus arrhizus]|nr:hypothetical protein G6F35_007943 [Rhizopus arrhizus]